MTFFTKSIKNRIFSLSGLATFFIVLSLGWIGFQMRSYIAKTNDLGIANDAALFKATHDEGLIDLADSLSMALEMLASNRSILQAIKDENRDELVNLLNDLYETSLKASHNVRIFHFHTADSHSFFRFHKKEKFGDDLSSFRQTVVKTNQTQSIQTGLEAGKFGIAFRIVVPLFLDGEHLGSVELSKDYLYYLKTLARLHHVEVALGINDETLQNTGYQPEADALHIGGATFLFTEGETIRSGLKELDLDRISDHGSRIQLGDLNMMAGFHHIVDFQGDEIGKLFFLEPAVDTMKDIQAILIKGLIALFVVGVLLGIIYMWQLNRHLFGPLDGIVAFSAGLENGDLSHELDVWSEDEIGKIGKSLNKLCANLGHLLNGIKLNSLDVDHYANALTDVSQSLFKNTKSMSTKTSDISSGSEELTISLQEVSRTAEDGSSNINMVASAGQEMNATISDIAQNSEQTRETMATALEKVNQANDRISDLEKSANEISQVISVIVEIAEQTKLLALNATIEAARAGEAGRGFNVVANEVKELAAQTNDATEEIRARIDAIQSSTNTTIEEFNDIREVITRANDMVSNIAAAVEEQAVTTRDMTDNISQAADRVNDVNQTSSQSFEVASRIQREVEEIDQASRNVYESSSAIRARADEMREVGQELASSIAKLKLKEELANNNQTRKSRDLIVWDQKYSVDINTVDEQHKKLINIINQLHRAMKHGSSNEAIGSIFNELVSYTEFHFDEEQKMMEKADYPELPSHAQTHKGLVQQVVAYKKKYQDGGVISADLMDFLKSWLLDHIMIHDKKYTPYLKKKGID